MNRSAEQGTTDGDKVNYGPVFFPKTEDIWASRDQDAKVAARHAELEALANLKLLERLTDRLDAETGVTEACEAVRVFLVALGYEKVAGAFHNLVKDKE